MKLELHAIFFFFLNFTYSCVLWGPIVAFLMKLELQFFFFLSLITPYSIFYKSSFTLKLDFKKIKLQNMDIFLISLKNRTKH